MDKIKKEIKVLSFGFSATRDAVRERDKNTCQRCGAKQQEGKRKLDVHHLDPEDEGTDKAFREHHNIDRMITLCRRCHMNLPQVRRRMSEGRSI